MDKVTELAQAARDNQLQAMERLIAEGVSEDGTPALVLAAVGGHLDALKLLRKHGANLEAMTSGGTTALMATVKKGEADCAEALLSGAPTRTWRTDGARPPSNLPP